VGRTGRAGSSGTALTLVGPEDSALAAEFEAALAAASGSGGAADAAAAAPPSDAGGEEAAAEAAAAALKPYTRLTRAAVEGLRYRAEDVARSITRPVIKEASSVFLGGG
jgi:ATP-dependent RNA helicase DDX56/DBP9